MEYTLKSGATISDEDIAEIGKGIEKGTLPGKGWSDAVKIGRPKLADEPLDTLSFRVPHSVALKIAEAAKTSNESKSSFLRRAAMECAERALG